MAEETLTMAQQTSNLYAGTVLDGTGGPARHDVLVTAVGGIITGIREGVDPARLPRGTVDHSGATLAPGFIDAHVHLVFDADRDHGRTRRRVEEAPLPELTDQAVRHATQLLAGGVTTARDCGDREFVSLAVRDAVRGGTVSGPRLLVAGPPLTITDGHLHWCGRVVNSTAEAVDVTRQILAAGVDVVKVMASGGNMTAESNARLPQFTLDVLRAVVDVAHDHGTRVAAHASNAESIRRCVAAGVDTLEHCLWIRPDGTPEDVRELIDLLGSGESTPVLTLAGIARELLPGRASAGPLEMAAARATSRTGTLPGDWAWAREVVAAGISVVVATDAGVRFTPFGDFVETVTCAIHALGVSAAEAVSLVTRRPAEALGLAAEVGTVTVGRTADLVVLEGAAPGPSIGQVRQVYREGRPVANGRSHP
ncbi:MAG: amidohydrolase family protein [Propionibacteriaceae bacterium]